MTDIDDKIRIRLAEIMSSAGVGYNQIALEILYLLPKEFIDKYIQLFEKAYGPAVRAPGDQMARDGELGKHGDTSDAKGKKIGAGTGGAGKKWKTIFQLKDERALDLKVKMDKRLRGMAREMRLELSDMEGQRGSDTRRGAKNTKMRQCQGCKRLWPILYDFCPIEGLPIDPDASKEGE